MEIMNKNLEKDWEKHVKPYLLNLIFHPIPLILEDMIKNMEIKEIKEIKESEKIGPDVYMIFHWKDKRFRIGPLRKPHFRLRIGEDKENAFGEYCDYYFHLSGKGMSKEYMDFVRLFKSFPSDDYVIRVEEPKIVS